MNQSDCEKKNKLRSECSQLFTRENAREQFAISFCFIFDWLKKVARKKSLNLVFT